MKKSLLILILIIGVSAAAFGQTPKGDISGIWNRLGGLRTLSDPGPAMTPAGQARYKANLPGYDLPSDRRMVPPAKGNDPAGRCDPLGLVRSLYAFRPVEFVVTPNRVFQFFEWNHMWRTIWTDGRPLPKDPDSTWYGYSVGRWEGDTLVVETVGVDDRTWIDHFGDVHSDDMHLTERWHRLDQDNMEVTMVLDDPKFYKQTWVSDKKMWRLQPKRELREEFCAPVDEQLFNQRTRNPAGGLGKK